MQFASRRLRSPPLGQAVVWVIHLNLYFCDLFPKQSYVLVYKSLKKNILQFELTFLLRFWEDILLCIDNVKFLRLVSQVLIN